MANLLIIFFNFIVLLHVDPCYSTLQKYALITNKNASHTTANAICLDTYGTTLASIHRQRDNDEMSALLRVNNQSIAWIGLERDETVPTGYSWIDGTYFDYGDDLGNIDAGKCVTINDAGEWNNKSCSEFYPFICYLPSELSPDTNTWEAVDGYSNWGYDSSNMEFVYSDNMTYGWAFIRDKQWYNDEDSPLFIDYTFSINFNGDSSGYSGIFIYNGRSGSICESYGVMPGAGSGAFNVAIDQEKYKFEYLEHVLQPLDFDIVDSRYYTLSIEIWKGNEFEIFVNDHKYVSWKDTEPYSTLQNGYSGFISLWSDRGLTIKAKYLYISGERETVSVLDTSPSNCITAEPTSSPIPSSTPIPTSIADPPTDAPSQDPISVTDADPSTDPPTDGPSQAPSSHPSHSSVHITTKNPTKGPTDERMTVTATTNTLVIIALCVVIGGLCICAMHVLYLILSKKSKDNLSHMQSNPVPKKKQQQKVTLGPLGTLGTGTSGTLGTLGILATTISGENVDQIGEEGVTSVIDAIQFAHMEHRDEHTVRTPMGVTTRVKSDSFEVMSDSDEDHEITTAK